MESDIELEIMDVNENGGICPIVHTVDTSWVYCYEIQLAYYLVISTEMFQSAPQR